MASRLQRRRFPPAAARALLARRFVATTVLLTFGLGAPAAQAVRAPRLAGGAVSTTATLKDIEALFKAGDFEAASTRLNELLLIDAGLDPQERAQIYLMKARLELAFNRKSELHLWLGKAFDADPTLAPDPVLDPPALRAVWDGIRRDAREDPARAPLTGGQGPAPHAGAQTAPEERAAASGGFWTGLMPLGAGHFDAGRYKDGGLFLSTELLFLLAANTLPATGDGTDKSGGEARVAPHAAELLGGLSFLGAYGYELVDLMPELQRRDPVASEHLRSLLSVVPFGVAQAKNGAYGKAVALAAAQSMLLTAGTLAPRAGQRRIALGAFGLSWIYGIVDGFGGRGDDARAGDDSQDGAALLLPQMRNGRLGLTLTAALPL